MSEVRLAVERALSKLIGRFGTTGEVIGELRAALAALDKQEAKQVREPAAAVTEADIPASADVPSPASETEAEPPPKKTRRGTGRKK